MKRIFIMLVFLAFVGLLFSGCSTSPNPESVVSSYLDCMKKYDLNSANQYLEKSDSIKVSNNSLSSSLSKVILPNIVYDQPLVTYQGDNTATVKVRITAPDMLKITTGVMKDMTSLVINQTMADQNDNNKNFELLEQYLINSINDPKRPNTIIEANVNLNKINGTWKISPYNGSLADAMTGTMLSTFKNMSKDQ